MLAGAGFTYSGDLNDLSGTIDWGDGIVEPVILVASAGGGFFANTHSYANSGTYPTVEHDLRNALWQLQPIISADRKYVRLSFKVDTASSLEPLDGVVTKTLEDGQPLLVDVSDQLRFVTRGASADSEKLSSQSPERKSNWNIDGRLLYLVHPRIVIAEEEEEIVPRRRVHGSSDR